MPVGGKPLLARYINVLQRLGIQELIVVTGYESEHVQAFLRSDASTVLPVQTIFNPLYLRGSVCSLEAARTYLDDHLLLMDGDVFCEEEVLFRILSHPREGLAVDPAAPFSTEAYRVALAGPLAVRMGRGLAYPRAGEWVGFARLSAPRTERLATLAHHRMRQGDFDAAYEDLLCVTVAETPMPWVSVEGLRWVEIDTPEDLARAEALAGHAAAKPGDSDAIAKGRRLR
jgi:choline kinase